MTPQARPPDDAPERRFTRFQSPAKARRDDDPPDGDPEQETIFAGLRTLQAWEVALFLGSIILSLLVWVIFAWVHRGLPTS